MAVIRGFRQSLGRKIFTEIGKQFLESLLCEAHAAGAHIHKPLRGQKLRLQICISQIEEVQTKILNAIPKNGRSAAIFSHRSGYFEKLGIA